MPVPEDVYRSDVDFTTLALQYPNFSARLKTNGQLDFSDPESVRQLTKALLHRDFALTIELPEDRLCPPVPNRFNYVLFAHRLLDATRRDYGINSSEPRKVIALDIGTGASAIYPLLACRQYPTWAFLATEIDAKSRSYAQRNIRNNHLESRIKLLETDALGDSLIPTSRLQNFDDYAVGILFCNPPFYASETEMTLSAHQKSRPPNSACTGAPVEMIVDGGEVQFVSKLINESMLLENRTKLQWFSSMLGKLSSVTKIVERLQAVQCSNFAVTEFVQGQKTRRWCVAWSWLGLRPPTILARGIPSLNGTYLPFPGDFHFNVSYLDVQEVDAIVDTEISRLRLKWTKSKSLRGGVGSSMTGDVWSRKARRKQQQDEEMKDSGDAVPGDSDGKQEPALAFQIKVDPAETTTSSDSVVRVSIRWLQGQDHVMFESFCGWLKRKAQSPVADP